MHTSGDTCISSLAATILDLSLPVTSDSIYSIDDLSNELSDLKNIELAIGILTTKSLEVNTQASTQNRLLVGLRGSTLGRTSIGLCGIGASTYLQQDCLKMIALQIHKNAN